MCVTTLSIVLFLVITGLTATQTILHTNGGQTKSSSEANSHRVFVNTRDELEVTRMPAVIAGQPCNGRPVAVFVHSAAQTSGPYYQRRSVIRKTWASDIRRHNISLYFAIGLSANQSTNGELVRESDRYKDILQFAFVDHYSNLTLKAICVLRWIRTHCRSPTHILKTDDDVVVNVEALLDQLSTLDNGFYGWLYAREVPPRNIQHKHYMPFKYYRHWYYPDYNAGNAYVMTANVTTALLDTIDAYNDHILATDDLFITGIIASKADIPRHFWPSIDWYGCDNICDWFRFVVSLKCEDTGQMTRFWKQTKSIAYTHCLLDLHLEAIVVVVVAFMSSIVLIILTKILRKFCRLRRIRKKI